MHCFSCDTLLTDMESTRKSKITGDYLDLCEDCYSTISDVIIEQEEALDIPPKEET